MDAEASAVVSREAVDRSDGHDDITVVVPASHRLEILEKQRHGLKFLVARNLLLNHRRPGRMNDQSTPATELDQVFEEEDIETLDDAEAISFQRLVRTLSRKRFFFD